MFIISNEHHSCLPEYCYNLFFFFANLPNWDIKKYYYAQISKILNLQILKSQIYYILTDRKSMKNINLCKNERVKECQKCSLPTETFLIQEENRKC